MKKKLYSIKEEFISDKRGLRTVLMIHNLSVCLSELVDNNLSEIKTSTIYLEIKETEEEFNQVLREFIDGIPENITFVFKKNDKPNETEIFATLNS